MSKVLWKFLLSTPVSLAATVAVSASTMAAEIQAQTEVTLADKLTEFSQVSAIISVKSSQTSTLNDEAPTEGSTLGFVVGMEPKLTGSDRTVGAVLGRRKDPDTGLHVEGFYKFKLTNNILITPGIIWLTAPGHNDNNDDIFVGTLRTTFTF